jgi:hypothetical protein
MTRQAWYLALLMSIVVAACNASPAPSGSADAQALASASAGNSLNPAAPSSSPSPSARPSPTATPAATATPAPTPTPTPTPWKSYTSKRFRYTIKYPPTWIVTPGSASRADQFDDFRTYVVFVSRDTVTGSISLARTVSSRVAYMKSHYKAKLLTKKTIRLAGYSGRILTFNATDSGRKVYIQVIILARGRVGYFIDMWTDRGTEAADRALFKKIYKTWKAK